MMRPPAIEEKSSSRKPSAFTLWLVLAALLSFAANSYLCRFALGAQRLDPQSFTFIRLASGSLMLALILSLRNQKPAPSKTPASKQRRLMRAAFLLGYALCFSLAYQELNTATGALLLFFAVQASMLVVATLRGQRLSLKMLLGSALAFCGVAYLLAPSAATPKLSAGFLMLVSGIAWGLFTLQGQGSKKPLVEMSQHFRDATLLFLPLYGLSFFYREWLFTPAGMVAALVSGTLTSALGYAIWYAALPRLSSANAASLQLLVPLLAAAMGAAFLGEAFSSRLLLSFLLTLLGIYLTLASKVRKKSGTT